MPPGISKAIAESVQLVTGAVAPLMSTKVPLEDHGPKPVPDKTEAVPTGPEETEMAATASGVTLKLPTGVLWEKRSTETA
jgi:hypothetical protein